MAGDWIKMRTNLDTNPHVLALSLALGLPEIHIVGALWKVWSWADCHSLDGNALGVTEVTLDRFTSVPGFAVALRKVGWLEGRDGALTFPRFAEHNGQTAKTRAETAQRVAKHRNARSVIEVTEKPLPEKRREEKSNTPTHGRGAWQEIPIVQENPSLADAIAFWLANFPNVNGIQSSDEGRIDARLSESLSAGWSVDKIIRSIRFSVTKLAKSWCDPDDDFSKRSRRGERPARSEEIPH